MASDTNRLVQIGSALAGYVGDNNIFPNSGTPIPGTSTGVGQPDRWTFHEAVDRYFGADKSFSASSIYNWQRRPVWHSPSAKAWPGWSGGAEKSPLSFGNNPNVNNGNWMGNVVKIPSRSSIVIMAEVTGPVGNDVDPSVPADTKNNVQSSYRLSHGNKAGLYLFTDFHVELLTGDRGYNYYTAHPAESNIWKWW